MVSGSKEKEKIYPKVPPTKARGKREVFRKARNHPLWHVIGDCFFYTMLENRFYSLKIKNKELIENRDKNYACIFFAPHSNWWDGIVGYSVIRRVFHKKFNLMVEELNRFPILSMVGAYSINKSSPQEAMKSLKYSVDLLKDKDRFMWIFPQGIIKPPNARPVDLQTGLAYIAQNAVKKYGGVNLVPVAVNYTFLREDKPEIIVDFGAPMTLRTHDDDRHELTMQLEDGFTQLLDAQLLNISQGNVDDYEYVFRQRLPWYKKFEKWLKRV